MTTQATEVLLYENIIFNQAALNQNSPPKAMPFIDSRRVRRMHALAMGSPRLFMLRRMHVIFMSNIKLRVFAPPSEDNSDDPRVVFGDATSSFYSSNYQKYAFTFE